MTVAFPALLQAAAPGVGSYAPILFQFVAIAAIFYFIVWRPQAKQRKAHEELLRGLKRGDQIVTAGGIVGEVSHIRAADGSVKMDDHVTIKSGDTKLIVERGRIARVVPRAGAATPAAPVAS